METETKKKFDFLKIKEAFKQDKKLAYGAIIIAALLVIVIVVVMLPGNRANRALKSADKLYIEEKYEDALLKYTKAFSIKENLTKAYTGLILSDLALGNGNASSDMIFADEKVLEYGGFEDEEGVLELVELFLLAPETLSDDPEKLIKVLADGYNYTNESEELLPAMGDAYILMGDSLLATNVPEALSYYDKALELRASDENLIEKMKNVVEGYVSSLTIADKFDEAYSVIDEYTDSLKLDAATLNNEVTDAKNLYNTKVSLLSQAYNLMYFYYDLVGKDFSKEMFSDSQSTLLGIMSCGWSEMLQLDGSEPANTLANSNSQNFYAYSPSGFTEDYTGYAVALYPYGETYTDSEGNSSVSYYFFYGEYKNGIRDGYGFSIIRTSSSSYYGFEGEWSNDSPNGFGVFYQSDMYAYTSLAEYQSLTYGNWVNGMQDGEITTRIRLSEYPAEVFEGSYVASLGNADSIPMATSEYEILDSEKEGYDLIAIAPSIQSGFDFYIPIYKKTDKLLSAIGY